MILPSAEFGSLSSPSPPRGGGSGWGGDQPTPRLTGVAMSAGGVR